MTAAQAGKVYLVGAGPGDPELLTLKASSLIRTADVILHDDLVPAQILALAGSRAEVVSVGKRCGSKRATQQDINDRMITSASYGLSVVRLKGGDPLVFGRLGEELDALRAAGITYEVVPGISAGFAAAAALGISLTDRRASARILIVSAHRANDGVCTLSHRLTHANLEHTTLLIYMPGPDLSLLRRQLIDAGLSRETLCVIVSRATMPEQCEYQSSLENLHLLPPTVAPSLLLLGSTREGMGGRDFITAETRGPQERNRHPALSTSLR